jgi:Ser/Thr protein kinase RdoA (MazF antagonist)
VADFDTLTHEQQLPLLLELAVSATSLYDLPSDLQITLINLSENATYKLQAPDGRRWALRIHRDGYHSRAAIASELAWLMALRQGGVVMTPQPLKGRDGEILQHMGHARMPRPRNVVLFAWEQGTEPAITEDLSAPFEVLGEVAARMHLHSMGWQRPAWFTRHTWDFETSLGEENPHWGRWREGIAVDGERRALFGRTVQLIGKRLACYGKAPHRFGLVHADIRLANLLIDGATVKVLDFDDSGFSWHMYDAATTVSFHEHEPQVPALIESWKKGYRRVRPLPKEDEAEIPTFIMLRRLLLVAWIGSHSQTDLARAMGVPYTEGTVALCEDYLRRFGG